MAIHQTDPPPSQAPNSSLWHWLRVVAVGRNPKRTLLRIVVLVVVSFGISKYVLLPIRVDGISMYPTYHDGQIDFINRLVYVAGDPKRGDVVGIRAGGINSPFRTPGVMYLKRIVGLPGETIRFARGKLLVNGEPLNEPYEILKSDWNSAPVKVGTNQYFLVGDNRSMPEEYHFHGRVNREQIVGRVLY